MRNGYQMNRFFIVSLSLVGMAMVLAYVLSLNDFMLQLLRWLPCLYTIRNR